MQTTVLINLIKDVIETNRDGKYLAGFRYSKHQNEMVTVDLYGEENNFFSDTATTNEELAKLVIDFNNARKMETRYEVFYSDEYITISEITESELLAVSKAFLLKEKYGVDAIIKEIKHESLQ